MSEFSIELQITIDDNPRVFHIESQEFTVRERITVTEDQAYQIHKRYRRNDYDSISADLREAIEYVLNQPR